MLFTGFTPQTSEYFIKMNMDNSKAHFEENRDLYTQHVKQILRALHEELVPAMLSIDGEICVRQARCVSGAYNDARFSRNEPIKTYMYLHYCSETGRDSDVPGFFMDASHEGYRFGLQIYHRTARGMQALREAALNDAKHFSRLVDTVDTSEMFVLEGTDYKRDHFLDASGRIRHWLNKKSWWIGCSRNIDDAFLSDALANDLTEGFLFLSDIYFFMLNSLKGV